MKKKTLAQVAGCATGNLNDLLDTADNLILAYEELSLIRDRISNGQMTDELYKFLDAHHSLEKLFIHLPNKDALTEGSMEALHIEQIKCVDLAMEGILQDIKDILLKIWNNFIEWIKDWTDSNRRMYFRLQRHHRLLTSSRASYGSAESYNKNAKGSVYSYEKEWLVMYKACKSIADIISKVPSSNIAKYLIDNHRTLATNFAEFGYSLTDSSLSRKDPKYTKQIRLLGPGGAGWNFGDLVTRCNDAMDLLKFEEASRTQFTNLKRAFDRAMTNGSTVNEKNALIWFVRICKVSKESASTVARAVVDVCNIAKRCA